MDYPCAKFVVIVFSAVLVISCGQTDRQTESHTDAAHRLTHATVVRDAEVHDIKFWQYILLK